MRVFSIRVLSHLGGGSTGRVFDFDQPAHELFGQQDGRCNGCRYEFPFRNITEAHVIPQANGGTDHWDNLQLLRRACNSLKGDRAQEWLLAKLGKWAA